jgi:hypothetical protein
MQNQTQAHWKMLTQAPESRFCRPFAGSPVGRPYCRAVSFCWAIVAAALSLFMAAILVQRARA